MALQLLGVTVTALQGCHVLHKIVLFVLFSGQLDQLNNEKKKHFFPLVKPSHIFKMKHSLQG